MLKNSATLKATKFTMLKMFPLNLTPDQMQQQQAQQQQMVGSVPYSQPTQLTISDHVLNSNELLIKLKQKLRGEVEVVDERGGVILEIQRDKRIVNDSGIHEIGLFLSPLVSKETKISQMGKDLVYEKYCWKKRMFTEIMFMNYDKWELKPEQWLTLEETIGEVIFQLYSGISEGRILDSITPNKSEQHQYIHSDNPSSIMDKLRPR